MQQVIT